jgi:anti-sigma B factor antagonist
MDPLTVSTGHRAGWTILEVAGELDIATRGDLADRLTQTLAAGGKADVVLDFSRLRFCDASGLSLLVSARLRIRARNGRLRLVCPDGLVRRLVRIAGLQQSIPVYDTLEEALGDTAAAVPGTR